MEIFARYIPDSGSGALTPTGRLESEDDRFAARTPHCVVIVAWRDRQLQAALGSSPHTGEPACVVDGRLFCARRRVVGGVGALACGCKGSSGSFVSLVSWGLNGPARNC
ncbi:hypothetical protein ACWDCB_40140 [Streptomyces sp. NPDC001178]